MDDMDHIQEAATLAQEILMAERRRKLEFENSILPPARRECDECGCDIPAARLKLRPLTRLCVDCQAEQERPIR